MFEQITDAVAYHAEGPVWAKEWGGLRWVDMLEGDLLTLNDSGEIDRLHVGSPSRRSCALAHLADSWWASNADLGSQASRSARSRRSNRSGPIRTSA